MSLSEPIQVSLNEYDTETEAVRTVLALGTRYMLANLSLRLRLAFPFSSIETDRQAVFGEQATFGSFQNENEKPSNRYQRKFGSLRAPRRWFHIKLKHSTPQISENTGHG